MDTASNRNKLANPKQDSNAKGFSQYEFQAKAVSMDEVEESKENSHGSNIQDAIEKSYDLGILSNCNLANTKINGYNPDTRTSQDKSYKKLWPIKRITECADDDSMYEDNSVRNVSI